MTMSLLIKETDDLKRFDIRR